MKLLRQTIRKLILEAIRMDEDLMILNKGNLYILADCAYMDDYPAHPIVGGEYHEEQFLRHFVKGMIILRTTPGEREPVGPCHGAKEVVKSAAIEGYGPTIYDVVMELAGPLINDRGSVSKDAKRVMQYYKDNRPDVEKKLLDNTADESYGMPSDGKPYPGKTPDPTDDCIPGDSGSFSDGIRVRARHEEDIGQAWEDDALSYAYSKDLSPRATEMLEKGKKFMEDYDVYPWYLTSLAKRFWDERGL